MNLIRNTILLIIAISLSGCGTINQWTGEYSPVKKEYDSGSTYLYGAYWDLLIFSETRGAYATAHLIDLPFSFCADVVLLPASIPLTNRNKKIPHSSSENELSASHIEHRKKVLNEHREAAVWLLENGMSEFKEKGLKVINRHLMDTWVTRLWGGGPSINSGSFIIYFSIGTHSIECVKQVRSKGYIYEYWILKTKVPEWRSERDDFYITKTQDMYGTREIFHYSDQFFESYEVDGVELKLPINDLEFLYKIKAWRYPESYKNTDLADYEIESDRHGYFVLSDTWYGKTGHLFRHIFGPERKKTTLK